MKIPELIEGAYDTGKFVVQIGSVLYPIAAQPEIDAFVSAHDRWTAAAAACRSFAENHPGEQTPIPETLQAEATLARGNLRARRVLAIHAIYDALDGMVPVRFDPSARAFRVSDAQIPVLTVRDLAHSFGDV